MGWGLCSFLYSSAVQIVKKKTAPEAAAAAPKKRAAPVKRPGTKARAKAVKKILLKVEKQMSAQEVKATLGDYIKLIQLSKEMTPPAKTEIRVMWIEEPLIPIEE
jgi:hypothetical protein